MDSGNAGVSGCTRATLAFRSEDHSILTAPRTRPSGLLEPVRQAVLLLLFGVGEFPNLAGCHTFVSASEGRRKHARLLCYLRRVHDALTLRVWRLGSVAPVIGLYGKTNSSPLLLALLNLLGLVELGR